MSVLSMQEFQSDLSVQVEEAHLEALIEQAYRQMRSARTGSEYSAFWGAYMDLRGQRRPETVDRLEREMLERVTGVRQDI